ncbi:MAG: ATP phosphoribosyltransferase [Actinomycetaceae bacterium]|nr:ATP phosphoribosyltransferase [Actinomycetaceae bacterium]
MLRIAVPNKGALSAPAIELLHEAGYRMRRRGRELYIIDNRNNIEIFFLRPKDIAVYVAKGQIHAGITGRDLLLDSQADAIEYLPLGFGRARFRFAGPAGKYSTLNDINGKTIATSFDALLEQFLDKNKMNATIVHLDGAVESSIQLGVADIVADVVETGTTLHAAGLDVFGPEILVSEALLITAERHLNDPRLTIMKQRLRGVLVARNYVLVDYNIHADSLDQAIAITPGFESPTVSHLHDSSWLAVRAMVEKKLVNHVIDELVNVGGRSILVSDLLSCRINSSE